MLAATAAAVGTAFRSLVSSAPADAEVRLEVGELAPDFSLAASDGRRYRLSDFRGRQPVVIAWFPKAFTGGCTTECAAMDRTSAGYQPFHAAVFGASLDTVETNRDFAAALGLRFPVLSDEDGSVARAYGVVGRLGLPHRWTFYIGIDGRLMAVDREVRPGTHGTDIVATLERLGVPRRP